MTTTYEDVQAIFEEKSYLTDGEDLFFYQYVWEKFEEEGLLAAKSDLDEEKNKILACALALFYNEFIAIKDDTTCNEDFSDVRIDDFILGKLCTDKTVEKEEAIVHACENVQIYKVLNKYFNINELFFCMILPFSADILSYEDYLEKVEAFQDDDGILNCISGNREFDWLSNLVD